MNATLVYITANEQFILDLSVRTHLKYDWVSNIVILHTDKIKPKFRFKNKKIKEYWEYFGEGFETSIEVGGFDEVGARNRALQLAYQLETDYYVITDSDEVWTYETINILENNKNDLRSMFVSTYPVIDNHTIALDQKCIQDELHDPHFRIINRKSLFFNPQNTLIQANPNKEFLKQFKNQSLHCYLKHTDQINKIVGIYHLHLKYHPKIGKTNTGTSVTHYDPNLLLKIDNPALNLYKD